MLLSPFLTWPSSPSRSCRYLFLQLWTPHKDLDCRLSLAIKFSRTPLCRSLFFLFGPAFHSSTTSCLCNHWGSPLWVAFAERVPLIRPSLEALTEALLTLSSPVCTCPFFSFDHTRSCPRCWWPFSLIAGLSSLFLCSQNSHVALGPLKMFWNLWSLISQA